MSIFKIFLFIIIYLNFGSAIANEKIFSWNMTEQFRDIKRISEIVEKTNRLNENLSRTEVNTSLINCLTLQMATIERKTINGSGNSEEFVRSLKEQLSDLSDFSVYPPRKIRIQMLTIDSDQYKNICKRGTVNENFGIEVIWITLNQNIKKWEASTEYKNEINANIAKVKKAEDEKRSENERIRNEEESKKAKLRQQCEKMKSWASDSRELIASALKTSISSVALIRFQMGQWRCLAIIDTPKGPEKCVVMQILQDKKSGEYFADMGGPFAVQAACGGLAF
jgi:hypothetical protein